jgi:Tfp pilus assembly protein PilE
MKNIGLFSKVKHFKNRNGFTLLELLIFSAIFAVVAITFTAVLISISGVYVEQSASITVNQESQFVMQTVQRYIENASLIEHDIADGQSEVTSTTLTLRMTTSSIVADGPGETKYNDRTKIFTQNGRVYIKEGETDGTVQPLTSDRVVVDKLEFIKRQNRGGRDSVSINLQISYNTSNIQRKFSQILKTAVTRVSAATFDSGLYPNANNSLDLGGAGYLWKSINGVINFNGGNVGIGVANPTYILQVNGSISADGNILVQGTNKIGIGTNNPTQALEVNGNIRLIDNNNPPGCDASAKGTIYFNQSDDAGLSEADRFQVCIQQFGGGYSWVDL